MIPFDDKPGFDAWIQRTFYASRAEASRAAPPGAVIARTRLEGEIGDGHTLALTMYFFAPDEEAVRQILGWLEFGMNVVNGTSLPDPKPKVGKRKR